jgi:hypothetical protein
MPRGIIEVTRKFNGRQIARLRVEVAASNQVNNVLTLVKGEDGWWTLKGPQDIVASVMRLAGIPRH